MFLLEAFLRGAVVLRAAPSKVQLNYGEPGVLEICLFPEALEKYCGIIRPSFSFERKTAKV